MQSSKLKIKNELWRFRHVVCFVLLGIVPLLSVQIAAQADSEQKAEIVDKNDIKEKILERDIKPSSEALARKERSIAKLKQKEIPTIEHLPVIEDSKSARIRTKEEIAHRAIALCLVAVKGEGLEQETVLKLVKKYDAQKYFTPDEKKFIENPSPSQQDRIDFSWRYEDYWVMLWALGYVDTLDYPDKACDVPRAVKILHGKTTEDFIANAKLRELSNILDEADLIYRYDWAVVNARVKKQTTPAALDTGVVTERHHALNWLIGYMNQEWDNVTTDT